MNNRRTTITFLLAAGLAMAGATSAMAAPVNVANWGTDSGSCGATATPCRSITQGIANSAVGGTIVVGPGVYGDLDSDGTLGEPGEETPGAGQFGPSLIDVNKSVTITSSAGAFATVISPGPDMATTEVMAITASGVTIGAVGKGFTILPTGNPGFSMGVSVFDLLTETKVAGNAITISDVGTGILSYSDTSIVGNRLIGAGVVVGSSNGVIANDTAGIVSGNSVSGCYYGMYFSGGAASFTGNVLHANVIGVETGGGNLAVTKSSFVGNLEAAVHVLSGTLSVTASNISGNGTDGSNCGLDYVAGTVTLTGNWWGAATGPGADPADLSCSGGPNDTAPATAPFKVKLKGLR